MYKRKCIGKSKSIKNNWLFAITEKIVADIPMSRLTEEEKHEVERYLKEKRLTKLKSIK